MAGQKWDEFFAEEVSELERKGERRYLRTVGGPLGGRMEVELLEHEKEGKDTGSKDAGRVVMLATSDVLGLAGDAEVHRAAAAGVAEHGLASGGSRLICGHTRFHSTLEQGLASWLQRDAALVLSTGYMANLALVPALVRRSPGRVRVYSDEWSHASLIDACRLARTPVRVFRHNDPAHLDTLLREDAAACAPDQQPIPVLLLEGVYSMDGDVCSLVDFARIAHSWDMFVVLDDTHGVGVLGDHGRGVEELLGLDADLRPHVIVGNLGKALGSFGAFVAGSARFIEYMVNTARPFIFTCALPPAVVAGAAKAVDLLATPLYVHRRNILAERAHQLRTGLARLGFHTGRSTTHIVPVIVGDNALTMRMTAEALRRGVFAQGIRYPSVPKGTARIRLVPSALHSENDIDFVLSVFAALKKEFLDPRPKI